MQNDEEKELSYEEKQARRKEAENRCRDLYQKLGDALEGNSQFMMGLSKSLRTGRPISEIKFLLGNMSCRVLLQNGFSVFLNDKTKPRKDGEGTTDEIYSVTSPEYENFPHTNDLFSAIRFSESGNRHFNDVAATEEIEKFITRVKQV